MVAAGVRPLALGVLAGGVLGGLLAVPAVLGESQATATAARAADRHAAPGSSAARRGAGFVANFAAPGALLVASGRAANGAALSAGLLAAAGAVAGAYWGVRQLFDA